MKPLILPGGFAGDVETLCCVEALVSDLSDAGAVVRLEMVEKVVNVLEELPGCSRVCLLRDVLQDLAVFDRLIDALFDWCFAQGSSSTRGEDIDWELVHLFEQREEETSKGGDKDKDKEVCLNEERLHVLRAIVVAAPELSNAGERLFLRYFSGHERFMRNEFLFSALRSAYISDDAIVKALETYPLSVLPKVIRTCRKARNWRVSLIDALVRKYHSSGMGKLSSDLIVLGSDSIVQDLCFGDDSFTFPAWNRHSDVYEQHIQHEMSDLGKDVLKKGFIFNAVASKLSVESKCQVDFFYNLATSTDACSVTSIVLIAVRQELCKLSSSSLIEDPQEWSQIEPVLRKFAGDSRFHKLSTKGWVRLLSRLHPDHEAKSDDIAMQVTEIKMLKSLLHSKKLMKDSSIKKAILALTTKCCLAVSNEELVESMRSARVQQGEFVEDLERFILCRLIYVESMKTVKDHRFLSQLDLAWLDLHLKADLSWLNERVKHSERDGTCKSWFDSCTFGFFQQAKQLQNDIVHRFELIQSDEATTTTLVSPLGALDLVMQKIHRALHWALGLQGHDLCTGWSNRLSVVCDWSRMLFEILAPARKVHVPSEVFELRKDGYSCPSLSEDLHNVLNWLLSNTETVGHDKAANAYNEVLKLAKELCEHTTLYAEQEYGSVLERYRLYVDFLKRGIACFGERHPGVERIERARNAQGKLELTVLSTQRNAFAIGHFRKSLERYLLATYTPSKSEASDWLVLLNDVWKLLLALCGLQKAEVQSLDHLQKWLSTPVFNFLPEALHAENTELLRDLIESAFAPTTPKSYANDLVQYCNPITIAPLLRKTFQKYGAEPGCLLFQERLMEMRGPIPPVSLEFIRNILTKETSDDLDERMKSYVVLLEAAIHSTAAEFAKTLDFLASRLKNERGSGTSCVYQALCSDEKLGGFYLSFTPKATLLETQAICQSLLKLLGNDMSRRDSSAVPHFSELAHIVQWRIRNEKIGEEGESVTSHQLDKAAVWLQFSLQVVWQQTSCTSGETALPGVSLHPSSDWKPWMSRRRLKEKLGRLLSGKPGLENVIKLLMKSTSTAGEEWFQRRLNCHTINEMFCDSLQAVRCLHYENKAAQDPESIDSSDDWLLVPLFEKDILVDEDTFECFRKLVGVHGEAWLCVKVLQGIVRAASLDLEEHDLKSDPQPLRRALTLAIHLTDRHRLWFLHFIIVDFVESTFKAALGYISLGEVKPIINGTEFEELLQLWRRAHKHGPLRKWFHSTFLHEVPSNEQDVAVFVIGHLPVENLYKMTGLRVLLKGDTVRTLLEFSPSAVHLEFVQRYLANVRQDQLMSFFTGDFASKTHHGPFATFQNTENSEPTIPLSAFVSAGRILGGTQQSKVGNELLLQVLSPTASSDVRVGALDEYSRWPGTTYDQYINLHKRLTMGNTDPRNAALLEKLTLNAFDHSNCSLILAYLLSPAMLEDRRNQRTAVAVVNRTTTFLPPGLVVDIMRHLLSHNGGKTVGISLRKAILRLLAEYKDTPNAGRLFQDEWNKQKNNLALQEEFIAIAKKIAISSSAEGPDEDSSLERAAWDILNSLPTIVPQLSAKSLITVFGGVRLDLPGLRSRYFSLHTTSQFPSVLQDYNGLSNEITKTIANEELEGTELVNSFQGQVMQARRMTEGQRMRWVRAFTSLRQSLVECFDSFEHRYIYGLSLSSLVLTSRAQYGLPDNPCLDLLESEVNKRIEYITCSMNSSDLDRWLPRNFAGDPAPFSAFAALFTAAIQRTFPARNGIGDLDVSSFEEHHLVLKLRDVFGRLLHLLLNTPPGSVSKIAAQSATCRYLSAMHSATSTSFGSKWVHHLYGSRFKDQLDLIHAATIHLKSLPSFDK